MSTQVSLLVLLLVAGVLLLGAEIFVPGAVLGILGLLCLLGAIVVAFTRSTALGFYTAIGVVMLAGVSVVLWARLFPRSSLGRRLTLGTDGRAFKAALDRQALVGREGIAQSELRPSGFALIDNRRVDVVAEGTLIPRGSRVRVVKVAGNRVVVRALEDSPGATAG